MIEVLITLLVALIIFALLWWVLTLIPFPPGFPVWVLQVVFALILVIVLISYLLPLTGVRLR
jgi:hypothetical protein